MRFCRYSLKSIEYFHRSNPKFELKMAIPVFFAKFRCQIHLHGSDTFKNQ